MATTFQMVKLLIIVMKNLFKNQISLLPGFEGH